MALKVKTYNNVQANVTFSKASSRVEINPTAGEAATENIALTLGKISKWYEALVPTGGSSGKILVYNSSGTAKWNDPLHPTITKSADTTSTASPAHGGTFTTVDSVTRDANGHVTKINTKTVTLPSDQNTDTKVTQTNTTTSADYRILFSENANDTTETVGARKNTGLKYNPNSGMLYAPRITLKSATVPAINVDLDTLKPTAGQNVNILGVSFKNADGSATHTTYPIGIIGNDATGAEATYNSGVRLGSTSGITIVAAGESSTSFASAQTKYNEEQLYLVSDGGIFMYTNMSNEGALGYGPWRVSGFTTNPSSGQVVITDGTAGGIKSSGYTIATSVPSGAVFTDTKVTSSANHYTPATASGSDKTASASGATAAWGIDVVKGITINTDGKGHITGLSVTSGKIPGNPDTDTKVTQTAVGSTYTNYRPLVISASNADSAPPTATTVTDGTFITSSIYCQPSSGSVYATKFIGPLQGNADTATKLGTANKGSVTKGIYLSGGAPQEMTYSLGATVNAGTVNKLAYYSGANAISPTPQVGYYEINSTASTPVSRKILDIRGAAVGNTAAELISGTAGLLTYGDGGPQINFGTSATMSASGAQEGALIYTDHDSAAAGVSWHFVSNQTDWNVTSKRFHARTSISIGSNLPSTSYNLTVKGTSYFDNTITIKGTSSGNASIYYASYGNTRNTPSIRFYDGDVNGQGIQVGGGGLTVIGGGESAQAVFDNLSTLGWNASSEVAVVASDGPIYFMTNTDTFANRKSINIDTSGYLNTGYINMNVSDQDNLFTSASSIIYSTSDKYLRRVSLTKLGSTLGPYVGPYVTNVNDGNVIHQNDYKSDGFTRPVHRFIRDLRPNKLAFTLPGNIAIEYSTDGGSNWVNFGYTDAEKAGPFLSRHFGGAIAIGPASSAERTTSMQTRITITNDGRDCMIDQFYIWMSTSGHGTVLDIQYTTQSAKTTWVNWRTNVSVAGWSGPNIINVSELRYGNTLYQIRFIFKITSIHADYKTSRGTIYDIQAYGGMGCWTDKNNMMKHDSLYTWDYEQKVTFPAEVKVPGQLRVYGGNYGTLLRNDGTNTYFLLTASGSAESGTWNSLRPFYFSNSTGYVTMSHGVTIASSSYGALSIVRSGSTNNAGIKFYNNGSTYLGSLALGTANGTFVRFKTDEATSYEIIDRSIVTPTPSSAVTTNWNTASERTIVVTKGWMSYWNGAYNGTSSNLAYCNKGAFGSIVTKSATDYVYNTKAGIGDAINLLESGTSAPTDNDYYISQWAGGSTANPVNTTPVRRTHSALWSYINGKISATTSGSGNAVTSVSYANGVITATKGSTFLASTTKYAASASVGGPALSVSTQGGDVVLGTPGTSSNDSGDIVWKYGVLDSNNNPREKARLWTANEYTAASGPYYRVYKSDGTLLYNGSLPLADGTGASGSWNINASTATRSSYIDIVASNEVRFSVATKPANATDIHIGHVWSDGTSDAKINTYVFKNGAAGLALIKSKGYYLVDSGGNTYTGLYDNGSNLWIGSTQSQAKHHIGQTYISAGYNSTNSAGNSTIYISVPTSANNNATNYAALHAGNFTTTGSGNAITSVAFTNEKLTFTKGSTFSLSTHTHNYAGSSSAGGAATSANKLNTNDGGTYLPVYFSNGVPVAVTVKNNTSVGTIGWSSGAAANAALVTTNSIAYWNGAYTSTSSNLRYCRYGEIAPWLGNLTTIGSGSPASADSSGGIGAKAFWESANCPTGAMVSLAYNNSGDEYSFIFSKSGDGNPNSYGSVLRWGYPDLYIRILRHWRTEWRADDWEKISAGYADSAGLASSITTSAASDNVSRVVFFAYNGDTSKLVYDNNFKYNPSTGMLNAGRLTLTSSTWGGLIINRTAANAHAGIVFQQNGTDLGSISMGEADSPLIRWKGNTGYKVYDEGNVQPMLWRYTPEADPSTATNAGLYPSYTMAYMQNSSDFGGTDNRRGYSGTAYWAHYLTFTHTTNFRYLLRLPFWGVPQYQHTTNGANQRWYSFVTEEEFSAYKALQERCYSVSSAGWYRLLTFACEGSSTSANLIRDITITVRRQYNNASPEAFAVRIIFNYQNETIQLLYAKQEVKCFTKIRTSRSSDKTKVYVELYYDFSSKNDFSVRYDNIKCWNMSEPLYMPQDSMPANGTLTAISDSPTEKTVLDIPTNVLQSNLKLIGSYWGMCGPDGNDTAYIRTSSNGLLPYEAGEITNPHSYIGTSSYYFSAGYIKYISSGEVNTYKDDLTRQIRYGYDSIDFKYNSNGGWATGVNWIANNAVLTSIGGYGNGTALNYMWIGGSYDSPALKIHSNLNIEVTANHNILLRTHANGTYKAGIAYDTQGNECVAFWAKNDVTRFRFHSGVDMETFTTGSMMGINPDFEIYHTAVTSTVPLVLWNPTGGNTPELIFRRKGNGDDYVDWRIVNSGATLWFDYQYNSSSWTSKMWLGYNGSLTLATSLSFKVGSYETELKGNPSMSANRTIQLPDKSGGLPVSNILYENSTGTQAPVVAEAKGYKYFIVTVYHGTLGEQTAMITPNQTITDHCYFSWTHIDDSQAASLRVAGAHIKVEPASSTNSITFTVYVSDRHILAPGNSSTISSAATSGTPVIRKIIGFM